MGVPIGEADGEHIALCECGDCGNRYEADESTINDCPECGSYSFEIVDGTATDPEMSWRDEVGVDA